MEENELFLNNMKEYLISDEGLTLIGCFNILALGSVFVTYLLQNPQILNIRENKRND